MVVVVVVVTNTPAESHSSWRGQVSLDWLAVPVLRASPLAGSVYQLALERGGRASRVTHTDLHHDGAIIVRGYTFSCRPAREKERDCLLACCLAALAARVHHRLGCARTRVCLCVSVCWL